MVSVARSRLRFATSSKGAGTVPERGTGMRTVVAVVVSVLLSALISTVITHHVVKEHARQEVTRTAVDSFNDGFRDGACSNGEDGYGHPCLRRQTQDTQTRQGRDIGAGDMAKGEYARPLTIDSIGGSKL